MENPKIIRGVERRFLKKNCYEQRYWADNMFVCGIDEAGRGPLAGPVVAAAVILPQGCNSLFLRDSKIMSEAERKKAYAWIIDHAWYGIGIESPVSIDTHNIYQATLRAMQRAFCQAISTVSVPLGAILTDAMPLSLHTAQYTQMPIHAFIKGEDLSISVAAASIVAKVTRDKLMVNMHQVLPAYRFSTHKGYGTAEHCMALKTHGISLAHRTTFLGMLESHEEKCDGHNQKAIW